MQNGGFQHHPLMRRTLGLAGIFIAFFVLTNLLLYFNHMDLTPSSVVKYYCGSEEDFRPARSYSSMLEVTHGHLAMMALVLLVLTHLVIFAPFPQRLKRWTISLPFLSALLNEGSPWLVRFVDPDFAWLKVASFLLLQISLVVLLVTLTLFLIRASEKSSALPIPSESTND